MVAYESIVISWLEGIKRKWSAFMKRTPAGETWNWRGSEINNLAIIGYNSWRKKEDNIKGSDTYSNRSYRTNTFSTNIPADLRNTAELLLCPWLTGQRLCGHMDGASSSIWEIHSCWTELCALAHLLVWSVNLHELWTGFILWGWGMAAFQDMQATLQKVKGCTDKQQNTGSVQNVLAWEAHAHTCMHARVWVNTYSRYEPIAPYGWSTSNQQSPGDICTLSEDTVTTREPRQEEGYLLRFLSDV